MAELLVIAFLGGFITGISPCIVPVLPVVVAGGSTATNRNRPLLIVCGLVVLPLLWFGIPALTSNSWFSAGNLALKSPRALHENKITGTIDRFFHLHSAPVWIAALVAIGRLQDLMIEKGKDEDENAGSSVRKYSEAFTKNGARRRTKVGRSPAGDKLDLESIGGGGEGDDDFASGADDTDC